MENWDAIYAAADALRAEFLTLNAQWFVDDQKVEGPRDCTPWNILAEAAIKAYLDKINA